MHIYNNTKGLYEPTLVSFNLFKKIKNLINLTLGTGVTLAKWLTIKDAVQFVLKFATKIMTSAMLNMATFIVIVEQRKMELAER